MQQFKLSISDGATPELNQNQLESLQALWASLTSTAQLREDSVTRAQVAMHGRFVISLTRQYQNPIVTPETLLMTAHSALVRLLQQYPNQPFKTEKLLAITMRNAMITAIEHG